MLFTVLLHVSRVTATETKAKREAKLFLKHTFEINLVRYVLHASLCYEASMGSCHLTT
jgi:hypothetical protein